MATTSHSTANNSAGNTTTSGSLCRQCEEIDWSNIPSLSKFKSSQASAKCNNGSGTVLLRYFSQKTRLGLRKSHCSICSLVGNLVNPSHESDDVASSSTPKINLINVCLEIDISNQWWLCCETASEAKLAIRSPATGCTDLSGNGLDYIRHILAHQYSNNELAGIRILQPSITNMQFCDTKLKECISDHEECKSMASIVPELRVIDVNTGKVCKAPEGCKYTALSYVWGKHPGKSLRADFRSIAPAKTSSYPKKLLEFILQRPREPQVHPLLTTPLIKDAIFVTKALGCQYLWVDEYCIDQDINSPHKKSMIQQMNHIYANAYVTIIAASGSGVDDGLPGLSGQPRRQNHVAIGKTQLIELSNVGPKSIMATTWATRGWTFQEGYLSKRRLIFMENELLFLCNRKFAKESQMGYEVDPFRTMDGLHFEEDDHVKSNENRIMLSFRHLILPPTVNTHLALYQELTADIELYSCRSLYDPDDGLVAFLGILNYYELNAIGEAGSWSHLWGIPMRVDVTDNEKRMYFDMIWTHESIGARRENFPSWTWAGWEKPVRYHMPHRRLCTNPPREDGHGQDNEPMLGDITVERVPSIDLWCEKDSKLTNLQTFAYERQPGTPRHLDPKELHITSFTVPLRSRKINQFPMSASKQEDVIFTTFAVKPGVFRANPIWYDRAHSKRHTRGLVLPCSGSFFFRNRTWNSYMILILHPTTFGRYERAGVSLMDFDDYGLLNKPTVLLDEEDNLIPVSAFGLLEKREMNFAFLKNAKWETIRLV